MARMALQHNLACAGGAQGASQFLRAGVMRHFLPPHPGPVASQARHQSASPEETNASRYVVPRGEGETFGCNDVQPERMDCTQPGNEMLPLRSWAVHRASGFQPSAEGVRAVAWVFERGEAAGQF